MRIHLVTLAVSLLSVSAEPASEGTGKDDELQAVIQTAVRARGGAENLAKLQAVRLKFTGTAEINGSTVTFSVESATRLPDRQRSTITIGAATESTVRILAGDQAWQRAAGQTDELKDEQLADLQAGVYQTQLSLLPLLKEPAYRLSAVGEVKVQERPAVGVRVSAKGKPDVNLYFEKASGLLVKTERRALGLNQQEITLETFFGDYKEVDGVKYPMTLVLHHDGKLYMKQAVTEVRFEDQIDDSDFARP